MYCKSLSLLLLFGLCLQGTVAQELVAADSRRIEQRQRYVEARDALASGDMAAFQLLRSQLDGYPLLPYLDYAVLRQDLPDLPADRVDAFLADHADTVLAARLEREWQAELLRAGRTADLVRYHNPANTSVELTCHVLQARLDSGDTSALDAVAPLWNVTVSQPNVCDPVFEAWLGAGRLTPDIGWQRFSNNLQAGNVGLARYVATLLPAREQALARKYLDVLQNPEQLARLDDFVATEPELSAIVLHGLQRLSLRKATLALELLHAYIPRQGFTDSARITTERFIVQRLLFQGHIAQAEALLHDEPELRSDALAEWLLRDALREQDWTHFIARLPLLSDTARTSDRWRYWEARSLVQQQTPAATAAAQAIYEELSKLRSFYGFLAADALQLPYAIVDHPVAISAQALQDVARLPALERARELFLVGEESSALAEWEFAVARLSSAEVLAAGRLAADWGWYRNGIQAMIRANYWDDMTLRFPLVYQDSIAAAVASNPVLDDYFVYAIARQESAFMAEVVSPAGAMGLMQLMPPTGRELARAAGLRITNADLLVPQTNITLGSRYLAQQLEDFGGNRVLAAAAYNAGPNRLRQWLGQLEASLPVDIWIETLPYAETRGYVQNVLAYAVIYAYRHGERIPLLGASDRQEVRP